MPIGEVIIPVVLFVTFGAVMILRPVARHLGAALEAYANDRRPRVEPDDGQMRALVESLETRLQRLEERQDFTDELLSGRASSRPALPGSAPVASPPDPPSVGPGGAGSR